MAGQAAEGRYSMLFRIGTRKRTENLRSNNTHCDGLVTEAGSKAAASLFRAGKPVGGGSDVFFRKILRTANNVGHEYEQLLMDSKALEWQCRPISRLRDAGPQRNHKF